MDYDSHSQHEATYQDHPDLTMNGDLLTPSNGYRNTQEIDIRRKGSIQKENLGGKIQRICSPQMGNME